MAFEFAFERFKLVMNAMYFVRAAIVSEGRTIWTADDIKIDVTQSTTADVKENHAEAVTADAAVLRSPQRGRPDAKATPGSVCRGRLASCQPDAPERRRWRCHCRPQHLDAGRLQVSTDAPFSFYSTTAGPLNPTSSVVNPSA